MEKLHMYNHQDLQERDDIVIVNANKGAVVTIDATDYIEKAERQITRNITTNYQTIKLQLKMKQSIMMRKGFKKKHYPKDSKLLYFGHTDSIFNST